MHHHLKNDVLTLVCVLFFSPILVNAAPSAESPPDQIDSGLHPRLKEHESPSADFSDSTQITPVASKKNIDAKNQDEDPVLATRKLSEDVDFVTAGVWMGSVVDNSLSNTVTYFRLGKSIYEKPDLATEYTLDLTTNSYLGWSTGYKFLQDLGKFYEPYMKVAVGALYSMNQLPGTFIDWQRYQLRGEIGCDDLFTYGRKWRAELGFSWSGFGGAAYVGTSFAF